MCALGYANGQFAPGIREPNIAPYQCAHNILKAHALTYRRYDAVFRPIHSGSVGIVLDTNMYVPANNNSAGDIEAAERYMHFRVFS